VVAVLAGSRAKNCARRTRGFGGNRSGTGEELDQGNALQHRGGHEVIAVTGGNMAKFEKFNPEKHLRGLAGAARRIQIEEVTREQDISFPFGANAPSPDKDAPVQKKKPVSKKVKT